MATLEASGTVCPGWVLLSVHLPGWVPFLHVCTKQPHGLVGALPGGDCWKAWPILDLLGREKAVGIFEVFLVQPPRNSQQDPEGDLN